MGLFFPMVLPATRSVIIYVCTFSDGVRDLHIGSLTDGDHSADEARRRDTPIHMCLYMCLYMCFYMCLYVLVVAAVSDAQKASWEDAYI